MGRKDTKERGSMSEYLRMEVPSTEIEGSKGDEIQLGSFNTGPRTPVRNIHPALRKEWLELSRIVRSQDDPNLENTHT